MSSVWTRANEHNVTKTPAVEGGEYADQAANPGRADGTAFVRQLIGDGAKVETTGRSIEYWTGDSMSDTGLAYNISGRATVIEAGVGERLAGFQDPIKAIFGTSICQDKTVIVKRKYVVGGAATITPERAPARTVQVREDVQSVELQRYGGDVTMNTNLFLSPGDASAEMNMKLDAQKKQLENKLVELGYNEIFDKALRLPDVAVRANPTFANQGGVDVDSPEARAYARTVYFRSCFGAFAKHEFPLANLLASCKTSGAYTAADGDATVLVIPHGSSEMLRYTKSSSMNYSITGLRTEDQKPVTMAIENVAEDPSSGVKIMVHVPPTSYARSAALPSTDKGMLSEDVSIFMVYDSSKLTDASDPGLIPDLQNGGWKSPNLPPTTNLIPPSGTRSTPIKNETGVENFMKAVEKANADSPMTLEERRKALDYYTLNLESIADYLDDEDKMVKYIQRLVQGPSVANVGGSEFGQGSTSTSLAQQIRLDGIEESLIARMVQNITGFNFETECFAFSDLCTKFGHRMVLGLTNEEVHKFVIATHKRFVDVDSNNNEIVKETIKDTEDARRIARALYEGDGDVQGSQSDWWNVLVSMLILSEKGNPGERGRVTVGGLSEPLYNQLLSVEQAALEFYAKQSPGGVVDPSLSDLDRESDTPYEAILKLSRSFARMSRGMNDNVDVTFRQIFIQKLSGDVASPPGSYFFSADSMAQSISNGIESFRSALASCGIGHVNDTVLEETKKEFDASVAKAKEDPDCTEEAANDAGLLNAAIVFQKKTKLALSFASASLLCLLALDENEKDKKTYPKEADSLSGIAGSWLDGATKQMEKLRKKALHKGYHKVLLAVGIASVGAAAVYALSKSERVQELYSKSKEQIAKVGSLIFGQSETKEKKEERVAKELGPKKTNAPLSKTIDVQTQRKSVGLTGSDKRILVRELKVKMSSAIIAKSGADTGELLVGYPMTGVSTNQRTESMTVALRVYLGAILKKPENVTVIPHVAFEGIVKHDDWFYATATEQKEGVLPVGSGGISFVEDINGQGRTGYAYPGTWAVFKSGKYYIRQENTGPLGHLDDPYYMECVNGLQVYKAAPTQTVAWNKYSK